MLREIRLAPLANAVGRTLRASLCGANLTVAAAAAGTAWSLRWKGKIVILEEVREAAYGSTGCSGSCFMPRIWPKPPPWCWASLPNVPVFAWIGLCAPARCGRQSCPCFQASPAGMARQTWFSASAVNAELEPSGAFRFCLVLGCICMRLSVSLKNNTLQYVAMTGVYAGSLASFR